MALKFLNNGYFAGKVGIGVNIPTYTLELQVSQPDENPVVYSQFGGNNGVTGNSFLQIGGARGSTADERYSYLQTLDGAGGFRILSLNPSGGKVGIGITAPTGKLTVVSNNAYNSGGGLRLQSSNSADRTLLYFSTDHTNEVSTIQSYKDGTGAGVKSLLLNPQGGNVGIGYTTPSYSLEIRSNNSAGRARVYADGNGAVFSANGDVQFFTNNAAYSTSFYSANKGSVNMRILDNGNVGIGTTNPNGKLQFSNDAETRKIVLWEGYNNDYQFYGFGVESSTLVYSTYNAGDDHVFFVGASATSRNELMRIKSTGSVIVGEATVAAANAAADNIVIKGEGTAVGLTISNSSNAGTGTIFFGDAASSTVAGFRYNHSTGDMAISAEDNVTFACDNVGIGTTAPLTSLDVVGGNTNSVIDTLTLRNESTGNSAGTGINFIVDGVNDIVTAAIYGQRTGSAYHQGSLQFKTRDNSGGGLLERMRINSSGSVGIGTTSPSNKLAVCDSNGTGLEIAPNDTSEQIVVLGYDRAQTAYRRINFNALDYIFRTSATERMRILSSGNVGIGTTSPAQKLDVAGNVVIPYGNAYFMDTVGAGASNFIKTINSFETVVGTDRGSAGFGVFGNSNIRLGFGTSYTAAQTKLTIIPNGSIQFNAYNSTNKTGTPTYLLGTDASGNIVKTNTVPGSGAGPYLPLAGGTMDSGANINMNSGTLSSVDSIDFGIGQLNGVSTSNLILKSLGDITYNVDSNNNGNSAHIFQESGNELMRIRYDGKVGIGNTSPDYLLDIGAENIENPVDYIRLNPTNGNGAGTSNTYGGGLIWAPHYNTYTKKSAGIIAVGEGNYFRTGLAFLTNNSASATGNYAERMRIDMDGNVGIGTTNPSSFNSRGRNLVVAGSGDVGITIDGASTGSGTLLFSDGTGGTASYRGIIEYDHASDSMAFSTSATERIRVTSAGRVGIGTTSPTANLHVYTSTNSSTIEVGRGAGRSSIKASADADGGYLALDSSGNGLILNHYSSDNVWLVTGGGNVGVGNSGPSQKLHITGNLRVTGAYYDSNNSPGTANQVLVSTASGTDWVDGSGSSIIGGPYLPLSAGSSYPLTGDLYMPGFIYHVGDTDSYFGFGAPNVFDLATGGSRKLYADSTAVYLYKSGSQKLRTTTEGITVTGNGIFTGNVGIGTTNPGSRKLSVVKDTGITSGFNDITEFLDTTLGSGGSVSLNIGKANSSKNLGKMAFKYASSGSNNNSLNFGFYDADNLMTILAGGNVGIGVTNPQSKLQVAGGIQMADDTATASANKVGTMRYRTGTEYVEVTGAELVTNGGFTTDTAWAKGAGWTIANGTANGTSAVTPIYQTISGFTAGNVYKVRFEVTAVTSGYIRVYAYVGTNGAFTNIFNSTSLTTGVYEGTFEFGGTNKILRFYGSVSSTGGFTGSIDNISVVEVTAEDASYADMCMQTGASTYEWVNIVRNTY